MPAGLLTPRRAAVVAGLGLATLPLSASLSAANPSAATPSPAAAEPVRCAADEVTVVVDFNEIGGQTRVACAAGGGTAAQLFEASGFPLTMANAPGMQGFVCRVSGQPAKGPCTQGDAYWSLWWSAPDAATPATWAYASLGVNQLEVDPGSHLGFAWHQGSGAASPPDVALPGSDQAGEQDTEPVTEGAGDVVEADEGGNGGVPTWLLVGGAVVVLGAAAVVPLRRRRQES